ncbi:MAG: hypothetical protein BJ554DRAFT_219 [Olpidium bornovanus]|uniref:Uncharacterized protein n=1 Tax=Olpidium bornovanus TaxID=278681 RepID=A0A8H7ZUD0_9FUNG|nr:MAG: hypothetical protein BJ554DRAFT_219 [Olpidium bornovanus]
MKDCLLLVFANKQDLPDAAGGHRKARSTPPPGQELVRPPVMRNNGRRTPGGPELDESECRYKMKMRES